MKKIKTFISIATILFILVAINRPVNAASVDTPSASGTVMKVGYSYYINWSGFSSVIANVTIELYKGSTLYSTIISSTPNDGSYVWTVPSVTLGTDYYFRISGSWVFGSESDYSNYYFTIANPQVTTPNVNTNWRTGGSYYIYWSGFTGSSDVSIQLYKASTGVYTTITSSTPNDGSYVWTVPSSTTVASDYMIKVTSTTNSTVSDYSDAYFAIANPLVTSPNASNISWRPGSSHPVTWTGFAASNVKIELVRSGYSPVVLVASTANDGSEVITIPASAVYDIYYDIKITSTTNTGMYDYSDVYFAIAAPNITSPNDPNISWRPGSSHTVTWTGFVASYVKIELLRSGYSPVNLVASTANDGSEVITIPASSVFDIYYDIKITSTTNTGMYDDLNYWLAIAAPKVTTPDLANICWRPGSNYSITWNGFAAANVNIELYKGSTGIYTTIASSTPNDGAFLWTIPSSITQATDYWIKVTSTTNTGMYDYSDYSFSIAAPQVTAPSAACFIWAPGYTYSITWTGYLGTYVKIDLYKGSTLYTNIAASTPNDEAESWTVPVSLPIGDDYRIRITSTYNTGITDDSDNAFNVALPLVTYPNTSGIVWRAGNNYTVTWSGFAGSNVKIELYKISTAAYTTLATSTPNDGTQSVTIPAAVTPATDYRIRISSAVCSNMSDYNDYNFTIDPPCILDLSATTLNFTAVAGVQAVSITSNTTWTVSDDASWLSATPASGTGNGTLIVNVEANSGSARTGIITVSGCSTTKTITVSQAGIGITLGNTTIYTSSATLGNRIAMPVTFTESGSIQSITIYHNGGTGNVLLGVYSDAATAPATQLGVSASTVINASAGWQTVPLNSPVSVTSGQTVWLSFVFQTNPGIRYLAGTPARALSTATWSGGMPATFGTATFANFKYSLYCTYIPGVVTKFLTVSPASISLGSASGTTGTFGITSNTTWSITDDAGWLDISPLSGSNNGTITVTANSANAGASARTATVTVVGTGVANQTVTVTQASGTTVNLGNTTIYSSSATLGNRIAMPVTFTEAGSIQSISIYHNGGTGSVLLGVYSDASASPATLLGVSASTVVNAAAGWQTVALSSPVSATSGQTVWLSFVFQTNPGIRYVAGTPARALSTATWSGGMPATFGSATFANFKYSLYCTYAPSGTVTKTLGNTTVYASSASLSNRVAMPVTFSEAGSMQSISIYHNGGSGSVLLGVYSDVATVPTTLLGVSASTVVNVAAGWQTVALTSPVSVTSGQTVWLSFVFQTNPGIRYVAGTPARALSTATWSGGMPATFGAATFANFKYSLYCTYVTSGAKIFEIDNPVPALTEAPYSKLAMEVYPNPSNGVVNFKFSVKNTDRTTLEIFSVTGKRITLLLDETMDAGAIRIIPLTQELPEGIYLYQLRNGKQVVTGKFIRTR